MRQTTIQVMVIPVSPVPAQSLNVLLGGQNCQVNIYQKSTGMFLDLFVSQQPIILAQICLDRVSLTSSSPTPFVGDIYFKDTQGTSDPYYTGLGSRFIFAYMAPTV